MVPLALHSNYSLMQGVNSIEEICRQARVAGYDRLALTDTDNLYGLWRFLRSCHKESLTPIIGATVTEPVSRRQAVCLVESAAGYANLCRLLTSRHCDPGFDLRTAVAAYAGGLVVLTADHGLLAEWREAGLTVFAALAVSPSAASHRLRQQAAALAIPVAAVPASFFLVPADYGRHCLLRAIARNTSLSRLGPEDAAAPAAWLAAPAEYRQRFAVWPEAIANTAAIAERCSGFTGPAFGTVLPPYRGPAGEQAAALLRAAAYEGARTRYGAKLPVAVVARLKHELRIIEQMGFSSYFLVVRDIVRSASLLCGRGSGAASLVAYCLFITNVCPLKHSLYFERFLNPGRSDPPDIDVDFAWDERDAILRAVLAKHREHAAMVCNHVLFRPRMAVREVAKVYGLPEQEISRLTRRLPWHGDWLATEEPAGRLAALPELRGIELAPPWPEIIALAARLTGTPRYLSVHPGGVIITPRPLACYVPIERAAKGVPVIQWEKEGAEEAGLVKIDLLGNRSLGVIRDAIAGLRKNSACLETATWEPEDDEATQQTIASGRTMGCFYIESPAMRLLEQKAGHGDFSQLVLQSSIIRPAANEYIREYLRRLHGGAWQPLHPLLAEVLAETFGIMVYQEDVSRVAMALAGFSDSEADGLRKVMAKKDRELRLADHKERFWAGARARGVTDEACSEVWRMMLSFDGYSFCKAHSASYARVSFQAAYLKTHFPAEFMAAVISNQGGFYSTFAYVSEARRLGLTILRPDVNESGITWSGRAGAIRVGLAAVREVSAATRERIVKLRQERSYGSALDFFERIRPAADEARALIHAGALDTFSADGQRHGLLWDLACWQKNGSPRGAFLFGAAASHRVARPRLPPQDAKERLRLEYRALGFLCDCHPLQLVAVRPRGNGTVTAAELPRHIGRRVQFAGWLITGKRVATRDGQTMEFLSFEDETGLVETTFSPAAYQRSCHLLEVNRPFLLAGLVEEEYGAVTLTVERASRL